MSMSEPEKKTLQTAIMTLADPKGNWDYAWQIICELAELNPASHRPHFAETELRAALREANREANSVSGAP